MNGECPDCGRPDKAHRRKTECDGEWTIIKVDEPFLACDGRVIDEGFVPLSSRTGSGSLLDAVHEAEYDSRMAKEHEATGAPRADVG